MLDFISILVIAAIIICLFFMTSDLPNNPYIKRVQGKNFLWPFGKKK